MIGSPRVGYSGYPTRLRRLKWLLVFHLRPPLWLFVDVGNCGRWLISLCLEKERIWRLYNDMYYRRPAQELNKLHKHNRRKSEDVRENVDFKQGELKGTDEGNDIRNVRERETK